MVRDGLKFALGVALAFLLVAQAVPLRAQSTFGTLLGTVKDATGAVVPDARVVITNTDEGAARTITTDSSGNYELVDVKPVTTRLRSAKPDSKPQRLRGCPSPRGRPCAPMLLCRSDKPRNPSP